MLKFEQLIPYHINLELVANLKLEAYTRGKTETTSLNPISIGDIFEKIDANKGEFIIDDSGSFSLDISIGTDYYSFDKLKCGGNAAQILEIMLNTTKKTADLRAAIHCNWFYFEEDTHLEEPIQNFYFFLCKGEQIIEPEVCISDSIPFSFPESFLLKNKDKFTANAVKNRNALTRLCYEKWQNETLPGRIYATKLKMEQEAELKRLKKEQEAELAIFGNPIPINKPVRHSGLWIGSIFLILVLVAVFVPEHYSILIFLGVIWLMLCELFELLKTQNYLQEMIVESIEKLIKGIARIPRS